jgi:DNA-binding transcriptional LysR family regulator
VFASEPDFDPATSEREFTVLISDYAITVLGPPLAALLQQAPHVRLRLHQLPRSAVDDAAQALRDVDAMVLPHGFWRTCRPSSCSPTSGSASSPPAIPASARS